MGRLEEAETAMRKVVEVNPSSAQAAYNLSVILTDRKPEESLEWIKKAVELGPQEPKYAYTYSFYLNKGKFRFSLKVLQHTRLQLTT